jgi:hypothetical protein
MVVPSGRRIGLNRASPVSLELNCVGRYEAECTRHTAPAAMETSLGEFLDGGRGAPRRRLAMAGVSITFGSEQHLIRLVAKQFARAMALEPGVGGLEPNSNAPRADRPEQLQNGLQTRYRSECLIKGISRKSILTLIRNGKNLSFLLPTICRGSEVAGTELAAFTDFLGSDPLRILQYRFQRLRLLLRSVNIECAQFHAAQQHVEQGLEVCLPLLLYASGDQGG